VAPATSVIEAEQRMKERRIGALMLIEAGCLVGLRSERAVMFRVVAEQSASAPAAFTSASVNSSAMYPMMLVRILLKSCAMPPAG
jgi:hypothetical protein